MVSVLSLDTNLRSLLPFVEPTGWCWVYGVNGSSNNLVVHRRSWHVAEEFFIFFIGLLVNVLLLSMGNYTFVHYCMIFLNCLTFFFRKC